MKNLKYLMIASLAIGIVATVYAHSASRTKKETASPSRITIEKTTKPPNIPRQHSSHPAKQSLGASGAIVSASPLTGRGLAEREAAYAPSDAFYQQAKSLYESGDMAGAESACLNALNAVPIVQGQPQPIPFVGGLLGKVYLKEGQYAKAVQWLQGARPHTVGGTLDLDLALAYLRLGDYKQAQESYSDQATLRYYLQGDSSDLPGTDSPNHLEASILLARGLDAYLEHRYDDALPDLQRANKLAPSNALIAYHCAKILDDKKRYSEATALYKTAAATGRGIISEDAKRRSGSAEPPVAAPNRPLQ